MPLHHSYSMWGISSEATTETKHCLCSKTAATNVYKILQQNATLLHTRLLMIYVHQLPTLLNSNYTSVKLYLILIITSTKQ